MRLMLPVAGLALVLLSACAGTGTTAVPAASGAATAVSSAAAPVAQGAATAVSVVSQICQAAAPTLQAAQAKAASSNGGTLGAVLPYLDAACNLDGTVAATLSPNLDANTPAWLEGIVTDVAAASQIAAPLLPLL